MNVENLTELLADIEKRYTSLDDTDVVGAFTLMRDSSDLMPTYEKQIADLYKEYSDAERYAKAKQAEVSFNASSRVAAGDRQASFDIEVLKEWKHVSNVMKSIRYLEAAVKFLSRIYFDCKLVVEHAYRKDLPPQNKMVGHT